MRWVIFGLDKMICPKPAACSPTSPCCKTIIAHQDHLIRCIQLPHLPQQMNQDKKLAWNEAWPAYKASLLHGSPWWSWLPGWWLRLRQVDRGAVTPKSMVKSTPVECSFWIKHLNPPKSIQCKYTVTYDIHLCPAFNRPVTFLQPILIVKKFLWGGHLHGWRISKHIRLTLRFK